MVNKKVSYHYLSPYLKYSINQTHKLSSTISCTQQRKKAKMKQISILILLTILLTVTTSVSSRRSTSTTKPSPSADNNNNNNNKDGVGGGNDYGGSFGFGPGGGFSIPGFDNNIIGGGGNYAGGYGGGYGGPNGGHSTNGVIRPTVVCKDRGPCYQKKVTCPARCFTSFSRSGKGYSGGGGGGGCTIDCKKKCTAYC